MLRYFSVFHSSFGGKLSSGKLCFVQTGKCWTLSVCMLERRDAPKHHTKSRIARFGKRILYFFLRCNGDFFASLWNDILRQWHPPLLPVTYLTFAWISASQLHLCNSSKLQDGHKVWSLFVSLVLSGLCWAWPQIVPVPGCHAWERLYCLYICRTSKHWRGKFSFQCDPHQIRLMRTRLNGFNFVASRMVSFPASCWKK